VNQTPIEVTIDNIGGLRDELTYASIEGGRLDIINTYEYSVSTKRSGIDLSSTYYTPVLETEDMSVAYILKSDAEPTMDDFIETANYKGLLQTKQALPEKILNAYNREYPNQNYFYLDTSYAPKTLLKKIQDMSLFIFLLFGGLFVRIFATRAMRE